MINIITKYKNFINENLNRKLTLYHGTCEENGKELIKNGWFPKNMSYGSNFGNPNYLYLSTEPEDALWFAEEKGCSTVVRLTDVPIDYLKPDPEDEAGFTMNELLDRIDSTGFPAKFCLIKPIDNTYFSLYKQ